MHPSTNTLRELCVCNNAQYCLVLASYYHSGLNISCLHLFNIDICYDSANQFRWDFQIILNENARVLTNIKLETKHQWLMHIGEYYLLFYKENNKFQTNNLQLWFKLNKPRVIFCFINKSRYLWVLFHIIKSETSYNNEVLKQINKLKKNLKG